MVECRKPRNDNKRMQKNKKWLQKIQNVDNTEDGK